jgi:acyl-CoA thioesterase FadM
MGDVAIVYKSQSYYGNVLNVQVTATDFSRRSFDLFYLITEKVTEQEIARAKTGIVCFNYKSSKSVSVPEAFKHRFDKL